MVTLARRLFWLAVLGGAGYAVYTAWQRRNEPMPDGPAVWPPLDDVPAAAPAAGRGGDVSGGPPLPDTGGDTPGASTRPPLPDINTDTGTSTGTGSDTGGDKATDIGTTTSESDSDGLDVVRTGATWVEPVDGECPIGHPIKGNANSGIYHVPGGRFYDRTVPDRCYAAEDDAVADGYRRAKA